MHTHANGERRHDGTCNGWACGGGKMPCKAVHNHAMGERPSRCMQKERGDGHKRHAMEINAEACYGGVKVRGGVSGNTMEAKNVKHEEHALEE